ncbi:DUF2087 domain-containing protein [Sinomonas sp. P47F7]|uniref:DUF2087 domain-containing protein n=1 Tax=Sinomonas sp. P47F7 TaxID=3410987 RepID=UPI003BF4A2C9
MQEQLIRLIAALANGRARERFAEISLGGRRGAPADPTRDRLLEAAGVLEELPGALVRVDEAALQGLLAHARSALVPKPEQRIEQLPRRRTLLRATLEELAGEVLGPDETVPETELNARLAERVDDVPRVRRALVDEGLLGRKADGSAYWRA